MILLRYTRSHGVWSGWSGRCCTNERSGGRILKENNVHNVLRREHHCTISTILPLHLRVHNVGVYTYMYVSPYTVLSARCFAAGAYEQVLRQHERILCGHGMQFIVEVMVKVQAIVFSYTQGWVYKFLRHTLTQFSQILCFPWLGTRPCDRVR